MIKITLMAIVTLSCTLAAAHTPNPPIGPGGNIHNSTQDTYWDNLQNAVDNADPDDVLILSPGDYGSEDWAILIPESITIRSTDPSDPAIVDSTRIISGQGVYISVQPFGDRSITLSGLRFSNLNIDPLREGTLIVDRCWIDGSLQEFGVPAIGVIGTSGSTITLTNARISGAPSVFDISGGDNAITLNIEQTLIADCESGFNVSTFGFDLVNFDFSILQSTILIDGPLFSLFPNGFSTLNIGSSIVRGGSTTTNTDVIITLQDSNVQGLPGKPGTGTIDADPMFTDPDGPDNDPSTIADNDYTLLPGSPSLDTGNNMLIPSDLPDLDNDMDTAEQLPFDLAGNPRISNTTVDMGAFETSAPPPCQADLNNDGLLDFFDISAFLAAYANQDPIADFNNDTLFDFFDISAFLTAYGAGCP